MLNKAAQISASNDTGCQLCAEIALNEEVLLSGTLDTKFQCASCDVVFFLCCHIYITIFCVDNGPVHKRLQEIFSRALDVYSSDAHENTLLERDQDRIAALS